ncbi:MAG: SsgA family sporulation/cell division regulator [Nocardioidaceae bacterium]
MDSSMYTAANTTPLSLVQSVALELIDASGAATPITAELVYDPSDPYAVTTVFMTAAGQVRWTFGRELLGEGIHEPAGDGDVHVWPCLDDQGHAVVIIELCSPDGEALVQARTGDLSSFVQQMNGVVTPGSESEHLDVDATIASILAAEAA